MRQFTLVLVAAVAGAPQVAAQAPGFRVHAIDAAATYSACAAFDVNRDGTIDIVSGGYWYEGPDWKRHFLREVESIRGRYDDYSNLPLDVNGDGWLDLVSCNYRSQSLYWVENPGSAAGAWTKHEIDRPGAMETGRLADIDQDGRLDVLPNGVQFAAWWELSAAAEGDGPRWVRHDLPADVAGHGIGHGDVNGDGRTDLVSSNGWLEAPADRRRGRWIWHPDFQLHRDAGIPILVLDVDGDGDSDLVWGRGHGIGLYWLEQRRVEGRSEWIRHAIDTSWSQPHSLLVADLDGNGTGELVAGKRYMGHDGKDPGEYDPLVAYRYEFDRARRVWQRSLISFGGGVGFGLDPKAADLDADGDLDLVVAGRSGLYWIENLGTASAAPPRVVLPDYPDHTELLVARTPSGAFAPVDGPLAWGVRRADILQGMEAAMGPLPDSASRVALDVQVHDTQGTEHYERRRISFASDGAERVPAWLLIPARTGERAGRRMPAMLCLHQTVKIGKDEPIGLGNRPTLQYAHELAERGYVCLAPDYPSFGEYPYDFAAHRQRYASGSMKAIWNNIRAVDVLESLPEVDGDRIGVIGHSLGGHNALFTAAFDQRLRAVVTSCGFTAFHHYYGGDLTGWTSDRYMPRIRDVYGKDPDRVPFDFYEVIAAIAPRPLFINAPVEDHNFDIVGVRKVVARAGAIYELLGAPDHLRADHPAAPHEFPDPTRAEVYTWLDRELGGF